MRERSEPSYPQARMFANSATFYLARSLLSKLLDRLRAELQPEPWAGSMVNAAIATGRLRSVALAQPLFFTTSFELSRFRDSSLSPRRGEGETYCAVEAIQRAFFDTVSVSGRWANPLHPARFLTIRPVDTLVEYYHRL